LPGSDLMPRPKLPSNIKLTVLALSLLESTQSSFPLNTLPMFPSKKSMLKSRNTSLSQSFPLNSLMTRPSITSIPLDLSLLEDPLVMLVWPEERLSLIHTVVGVATVVVLSQERTPLKSTDLLHMLLDGLLNLWLPTSFARELLFKLLMVLVCPILFPFTLKPMEPVLKIWRLWFRTNCYQELQP